MSVLGSDPKFPDFFTRDSGHSAPCHVESPTQAALMMKKRAELDIDSGMLIAVPIPQEHEAEGQLIKDAIGKVAKFFIFSFFTNVRTSVRRQKQTLHMRKHPCARYFLYSTVTTFHQPTGF